MALVVTARAQTDIHDALEHYDELDEQLAQRWLLELQGLYENIQAHPGMYRVVHRQVRRVVFRRFPHAVFYRLDGEDQTILRVLHARSDPAQWPT
ncbi:MAG: type II toxin-antitoxin system RelE/ParE family toxin [Myxococcota bacterium]